MCQETWTAKVELLSDHVRRCTPTTARYVGPCQPTVNLENAACP
jgi:hypothetical protein